MRTATAARTVPIAGCRGGPSAPDQQQLIATARDVTADKLQAEALREAEERFEVYMNHSPAIAFAKDEEGRIAYYNKAYEERFQIQLADWRGKTDFDRWPPDVAERFWQNDQKVFATGVPLTSDRTGPIGGRPDFLLDDGEVSVS